ncbi:MAG: hypothetical protein WCI55_12695 [Armatimonadota bacterium]
MKRIGEIYQKFRFLLIVIPFLVFLLPLVAKGWSPRFWDALILLTQCPFIAIGHSVRDDENMSGLFSIGFIIFFFVFIDQFARITYAMRGTTLACVGVFALMLLIEVMAIEVLGWALAKLSQKSQ